jgi:rod shape-determining protein MreC
MRDSRRTRLVLGLLLVTAFALITLDVRGGETSPLSHLRDAAQAVFGPIERAAASVVRPVSNLIGELGGLGSQQSKIDALQRENSALQLELRTSDLARNRAAELDKLLNVAGLGRYKIVPAQVIAVGSEQGFAWTATIDAGTRDGLRRDMTVLSGDGLVGRLVSVGPSTSTVLLLNDPTFAVGARVESSMEIGWASGGGDNPMALSLLNAQGRVAAGDRIVTLGSRDGKPFVPGVPIGEVLSVKPTPGAQTRTAYLKPYVDVTTLDIVGIVVQPPRRNPRDAVLPPIPTPSVTGSPLPTASPVPSGTRSGTPSPSTSP